MRRDENGVFAGQQHPTRRARPQCGVRTQRRRLHPCRRRAQRVFQSEASHVFDVDVVVEEDQITTLVFTYDHRGGGGASVGAAGGGGGGATGLGGRQGAVGADRNWADKIGRAHV